MKTTEWKGVLVGGFLYDNSRIVLLKFKLRMRLCPGSFFQNLFLRMR